MMRRCIIAVVVLLVALLPAPVAATSNPGVLPVQSHFRGHTYGEWSAMWWQWAFASPVPVSPLFDLTGEDCAVRQSGNVWFLAGVLGEINESGGAIATRTCTIPTGTALFFPILNVEADNNTCDNFDPTVYTRAQLRALAGSIVTQATDMFAEVDGVPVTDVSDYRAKSPVFSFTLPADNILEGINCPPFAPGTYSGAVADGYYLMLHPLPPGEHTIHFGGSLPGPFTLDVTYHITVA